MAKKTVDNLPAVISPDEREKIALTILKKSDLKTINDFKDKIKLFTEKYTDLQIVDENDKDGYEIVRKAVADMRGTRTSAERERKDMTKPYRETTAFINDFFDIADDIKKIEQPLKDRMDAIDEIEEAKKRQKKEEQEKRVNDRINELIKNGCTFDGNYYSIVDAELGVSETSIGIIDVRDMSDDIFKELLQVVINKNATITLAKEQKEKEANEKREAEAEQQRKNEKLLQEQQQQLEENKRKMEEQQQLIEKQQREMRDALVGGRKNELKLIGLLESGEDMRLTYKDLIALVTIKDMVEIPIPDWAAKIEEITGIVNEIRTKKQSDEAEAEQQRIAQEKEMKLNRFEVRKKQLNEMGFTGDHDFALKDVWSVAYEQVLDMDTNDWPKYVKDINEAISRKQQKDEEAAAADDKTKWGAYIKGLKDVPVPTLKSKANLRKMAEITTFLNGLK